MRLSVSSLSRAFLHPHSHSAMPKAKSKLNYYAVKYGRRPGVYRTWGEAEQQVVRFPGAIHRGFKSIDQAEAFVGQPPALSLVQAQSLTGRSKHVQPSTISEPSTTTDDNLNDNVAAPPSPVLSAQQTQIVARVLAGENFFFTGSAGTGKSVLLRAIVKAFREREEMQTWQDMADGNRWSLGVTASTGMAAVNIGGTTLHSWAGIGLGDLPVVKLCEKILRNKVTVKRWRNTAALVIDEISMIDAVLFDKMEEIGRKIRKDSRPFGGLQIILSGDFFQLPPVAKANTGFKFAFEAESWQDVIPRNNMLSLTRVFRQTENHFVRILEGMRRGKITPEDEEALRALDRPVIYADNIEPVSLYPQKKQVTTVNQARLAALTTPLQVYMAWDIPGTNSKGYDLDQTQASESLDRNTIWPKELSLKVGALVMLVTDGVLVNGSTGIVVDFMTLTEASKAGVRFPSANFGPSNKAVAWPVIEFAPPKHIQTEQTRRVIIPQMSVDVLNAQGKPEATRHQVPLILAWALTIHKSQGQTLDRVKIDLGNIFVEGQTYVAISRAVSLDNLEIKHFDIHKVMAHPRVIEWARPFEQEQADDEEWDELLANADFGI